MMRPEGLPGPGTREQQKPRPSKKGRGVFPRGTTLIRPAAAEPHTDTDLPADILALYREPPVPAYAVRRTFSRPLKSHVQTVSVAAGFHQTRLALGNLKPYSSLSLR